MRAVLFILVVLSIAFLKENCVSAQDEEARPSLLLESVINGDIDGIDAALNAQESIDTVNVNGWSAAHFAVSGNNFALLEAVVNRGIDLNLADNTGYTALMMAARQSDLEMVELMVSANADPLLASNNGDTAHSLAANRHRVALVIAEASAIHAIERNDMDALLDSVENGAYVNIHNPAGWTPLIYATAMGNVEAVKTLLHKGAEPDRQENDGWTALMFAASAGNEALVTTLLQAGASAGVKSGVAGDGPTAKEIAIIEGHVEVAELIPDLVETVV
eukprot:CAMPEP_0170385236 /NCGR_PEP_ID=MMETSP0117_2-20130122/16409_1 /TAXON_ID=400756 /ORGANISM="Durinskia baltica, Strain CSIRO CS-38" /LENGTH=275 /DNA_ID=CAMNT_0010641009 /DNA_START=72 /DNA_END=899 /DNA_ORIENTATION=+